MAAEPKFIPGAARVAALDHIGRILIDEQSLADPSLPSVILVEFQTITQIREHWGSGKSTWAVNKTHACIYHPYLELCEFLNKTVGPDHPMYRMALATINHFRDQLLNEPVRILKENSHEAIQDLKNWCDTESCEKVCEELTNEIYDGIVNEFSNAMTGVVVSKFAEPYSPKASIGEIRMSELIHRYR